MNTRRFGISLSLTAFCFAGALFGQSAAPLHGTVLDPQGRPIRDARLSLFNSASATRIDQVQSSDGQFEFSAVPGGRYLIEAAAEGFRQTTVPVEFQPTANSNIEIKLEVQGVSQSILVTAEAAAQSLDQVAKSVSVLDRSDIDDQDEPSLTETLRGTPGLVIRNLGGPGQSTSIRSRGLGPSATSILIDGMRFRDAGTTQGDASSFLSALNIINPDRIEVLRGSGSSLYGTNAVGGVVNVVTDQGGAPTHGDIQVEGGALGLLRGRASVGGATLGNRLAYSAGLLHLNVMDGVDGDDRARSTGAQGYAGYHLNKGVFASVRLLVSDDFVQPNSSPTATGIPAANIPNGIILPAIALSQDQVANSLEGRPIQAGGATFIPSRDDPDNRRASRLYSTATKVQQTVNSLLNWQASYQHVNTNRIFQNGPAGIGSQPVTSNFSQFTGGIDTVDARATFRLAPWDSVSGGYEFERESYFDGEDNKLPGANRVATQTRAWQSSNAVFLQNQLSLLNQKLQIYFSGRSQSFDLERPSFVTTGTANTYASIALTSPPRALTGDIALSYFVPKPGTKLRAHAGNSYRAPGLSERFGSGFFFDSVNTKVAFTPYGDPGLAPDRYNSFDAGVDQYLVGNKVRLSGTFFYTRIVQVILFDSAGTVINARTDIFGRTSGYFNAAGGISRGVELSAEVQPTRSTRIDAGYTYTNADTDQDVQVKGFFKAFAIPAHLVSFVASQQLGRKTDATLDLNWDSSYFNPLSAAGRSRAYQYPGVTRLGLMVSRTIWTKDAQTLRLYGKVDNLLNQEYYETGFRTPGITWVAGLRMNFR